MTDINKKINIQIYSKGAQLSLKNGFNTTPMTRKDLQVLISDALIVERAMGDAERVRNAHLKAVS